MNIDDFLPPHPVLPENRFWHPIQIHKHAVIPLLPFSEMPFGGSPVRPRDNFEFMSEDEIDVCERSHLNVGLFCGKVSGVTVLEVSTHSAQLWLVEQDVPWTPQWLSRNARYYLFNYVPDAPSITDIRPGLRLLNDGTQVIYPGSIYHDGRLVYWEESPDFVDVADLPDWLLADNIIELAS